MPNAIQTKIAEQTIRHIIIPMLDKYAGNNQENLIDAINRDTDLAPIIRDNWGSVAPLPFGKIQLFAKQSTTKDAVTTQEVYKWLAKEKPKLAAILDKHPNGQHWLEKNVRQIRDMVF